MRSPDFAGYPESEPAVSEIARADLMRELAVYKERVANEAISRQIIRQPELAAMLGKYLESGPELDPDIRAHLRKMIALWIGRGIEFAIEAGYEASFYELVRDQVILELEELSDLEADVSDIPDLWDLAAQDLFRLEGGTDIP
jgi:hypothetical protein